MTRTSAAAKSRKFLFAFLRAMGESGSVWAPGLGYPPAYYRYLDERDRELDQMKDGAR
jgi:hypothetical protein